MSYSADSSFLPSLVAAERLNQEKGKKIEGQKNRRLRERRAIFRGPIFLPQIFLPLNRSTRKRVMPTDGKAVPRIRPHLDATSEFNLFIRGTALPSVGTSFWGFSIRLIPVTKIEICAIFIFVSIFAHIDLGRFSFRAHDELRHK
jgi:hypothetical protein